MGGMNLRQIEIFRALMRSRSTVVAARELGMSQPAVSNALKAMERALGFPLFSRISKRLVPTDDAQILLDEAEPLFLVKTTFDQTAATLRTGHRGSIRVVATAELSEALLPPALAAFSTLHPDVQITLETLPLDTLTDQVIGGIADMGFAMGTPARANLSLVRLADLRLMCAFDRHSDPVERIVMTPHDLQDRPIINTRGMVGQMIRDAFHAQGVAYLPRIDVRFMNVATHMARGGLGVAFTDPLTAANIRGSDLAVLPFDPEITFGLDAVLSAERAPKRLVADLIASARRVVESRLSPA